jgi:arabinogalactan oligomer/maltooligosaccharide transport system permease protein
VSETRTSHRRQFIVGLALASLFGAGTIHLALTLARSAERESLARRSAVVRLQALVQTLDRVGGTGAPARAVVERWSRSDAAMTAIRVVAFEGVSLEASTAPSDQGAMAAPRRLVHEEKPIYDQGQRLRAAVEINRQEGAPRKSEIEIEALSSGGLALAAPLERDGAVVGMASIETVRPAVPHAGGNPLATMLAIVLPVALFWLAARWVEDRRAPLAVLSAVLLTASLVLLGVRAVQTLQADRRASEETIANAVGRNSEGAASVAASVLGAAAAPIDRAALDVDEYRRPRGFSGTPAAAAARLREDLSEMASGANRILAGIGLLSLALLGFVGLGAAARLAATLRKHREAYLYVLPAMAGMLVLVFFPFIYGVILSFTDSTLFNTDKSIPEIWVGLRNYGEILGDFSIVKAGAGGAIVNYLNFYWTLFNTVLWTVLNVTIGVSVGLFLALILNTRGLALRPIYRVLLILPWAMPNYITSLIWRGMFHQQFGVINQVIQIFGGHPLAWFDKWSTSFATALATNGWLSFPFMMVVSLGALQSIPGELYEASRMDGASRWQQFRSITLPSLKPALVPAIILSVIWTFNMFNIIYLVTQGEPGSSTEILITQSYKFAFERYRYGYAAAYSTVIFAILLLYGWWQNRATRATEGIA